MTAKQKRLPHLAIVTGTRAEYGLLKPLIQELLQRTTLRISVVVTGMHTLKEFGHTIDDIRRDHVPIASVIPLSASDDMISALSKEIIGLKNFFKKRVPDAILATGDRDEAFAAASVAVHRNIPVIHISGGDVSGKTVDHVLRNAITVFSSLHLTQTDQSRRNVIRLGADSRHAFVVGSLGLDGLTRAQLLSRHEVALRLGLDVKKSWHLVLHHPTPFDTVPLAKQITPVLQAIRALPQERLVIYPNSDSGGALFIRKIRALRRTLPFHLFANLDRPLFTSLLAHSIVFIGNSSCGLMEAGFLRVPFVNIGNRQGNRERGPNVIAATYSSASILRGVRQAHLSAFQRRLQRLPPAYHGGPVVARARNHIEHFLTHHA